MKPHRAQARAVIAALAVTAAAAVGGAAMSSAAYADQVPQSSVSPSAPAVAPTWIGKLTKLEQRSAGAPVETNAVLANAIKATESRAKRVGPNESPILTTDPRVGDIAAPIRHFRDGGHAYYLFDAGLHSCTYTGKCMDLFAPVGEPVFAMSDGVVAIPPYAGGSYGNHIKIKFKDGSEGIYAHLLKIVVKPGPVKAGTLLGAVGCSGTSGEFSGCDSAEPHLHFEWSDLKWSEGEYGELPPAFKEWRGRPARCYQGC